tara:strand:- start:11 stop:475 length:465 start_codon:yes stop_codon:yes gene_type:complete
MFTVLSAGLIKRRSKKRRRNRKYRLKNAVKGSYRTIPTRYVPSSLSSKDRIKQLRSIINKVKRPYLKSFKSKKSGWTAKFHKKYGKQSIVWISKNLIRMEGIKQIRKKGIAAYYTSGSRPNQTPQSWWKARLYSVILGGPARRVDKNIWRKYRI